MENEKMRKEEKTGEYYMGILVTIVGIIILLIFTFGAIFG